MVHDKDKHKHKHTHGHHSHHHKRGHDNAGDDDDDHHHHHHRHGSSHNTHTAAENTKISFPCHDDHRECRGPFHKQKDIKMHNGSLMDATWQPCRVKDVQNFILKWRAPPEGGETQGGAQQQPQSQQADQPQEPQDGAPGPSSHQHPTTGAPQPVSQQEAGPSGGGNTMEPGPSGQTVPGPGAPPPSGQPTRPDHQWMPGDDDMVYDVPGSHREGTGYSGESYAGEYEGGEATPYPDDYGGGEGMSNTPGPGGKQGGSWPGSTVGPLVEPPRAQWVAHRPENLYQGEKTDGVTRSQPHQLLPAAWNEDRVDYSIDYSQS
ncbi:hypothetical protein F5883DRAFT_527130 [Diaporthe sp. PMI_573]|nr:hypothetical protein F5883DRAFT_527130 [Diaporthaceae sp. PMI_573]